MIYSAFEGRIGNNLFQLAACLSLASFHNTQAVCGNAGNMMHVKENFLLEDVKFIDTGDISGFQYRNRLPSEIKYIFKEKKFQYDENFFSIPDNTFIDGFFQSEKYFKSIEDKVRKNFTFKKHIIDATKQIDYFNPDKKRSGFIHIRRTDYLEGNNINAYPQQPIDYYLKCIHESKLKTIYIFSDDINWCIDTFKNFNGVKFIPVMESNPYISLCMMTQLNTSIITNSTFGWWGAWLNPNKNKKIYHPIEWFGKYYYEKENLSQQEYMKDIICEGWLAR